MPGVRGEERQQQSSAQVRDQKHDAREPVAAAGSGHSGPRQEQHSVRVRRVLLWQEWRLGQGGRGNERQMEMRDMGTIACAHNA